MVEKKPKGTCRDCPAMEVVFTVMVCGLGYRIDGKGCPTERCEKPEGRAEYELIFAKKFPDIDIVEAFKISWRNTSLTFGKKATSGGERK